MPDVIKTVSPNWPKLGIVFVFEKFFVCSNLEETAMTLYIGVDFHPHQQTVCWCDEQTGELRTRTFFHNTAAVTEFYQSLPPSTVGIEASGKATWFEKLLFDNQHKLLVGNPELIRKRAISRHKNDNRDAQLIFELLRRDEFPELWQRPAESVEILEMIRLRHRLVKQLTQAANQLQALAHAVGLPAGKLRSKLFQAALKQAKLPVGAELQRQLLFETWEYLSGQISKLEDWLAEKVRSQTKVKLLCSQAGVGYLTALCLIHTLGDVSRFDKPTKQVPAFVGLEPVDESSARKIRFGKISKCGSPVLRFLLGQATQTACRLDQKFKAKYRQLAKKKHRAVAKTAMTRKLLVKLVIMLRDSITAQEFDTRGRTVGNARGSAGAAMPGA
jgi:transposase